MLENEFTVQIDCMLEDLMPGFLQNRQTDISSLEKMYAAQDLEGIKRLGHHLKGVGPNYGFQKLGEMGAAIEIAACHGKLDSIGLIIQRMREYMSRVKIQYC
ncbi:MAG: Hpt domain-containing protein [Pseudomonadota bacterium]|nr:Hpt domain-containing protein [Pseudomonadota bacterium]